jgi:hypothetical protein
MPMSGAMSCDMMKMMKGMPGMMQNMPMSMPEMDRTHHPEAWDSRYHPRHRGHGGYR